MQTFVLAGGFATRLWPLTEKRAKPLLPLAGKPILSYPLHELPKDLPVTVSTNAAFEDGFHTWKQDHKHDNVQILIEQTKHDDQKLGALGAVAQWIETHDIDDDVLLLTGDNYFGFNIQDFLDTYKSGTPILAAYDIGSLEAASTFGTVITHPETNHVQEFEEKPKNPKTTLVSTGCSILPKEVLPLLLQYAKENPDNVGGIFEELLRNNHDIHCFSFSDPWFDIGSFHAYLEATKKLVGAEQISGQNSIVEHCKTNGSIVIGDNCTIKNSELHNVVIFDNCEIENCILEDCIIDNHSVLKGVDLIGKMLREKTKLIRT